MDADSQSLASSLQKLPLEEFLLPVLIQLTIIVAAARVMGFVARYFKQTAAVGEIIAGLMLGPSLFGWLAPEWFAIIFQPTFHGTDNAIASAAFSKVFLILSQIGLVFLLFLIGLEFDFAHLKAKGKAAVTISVMGIIVPFFSGFGLAYLIHPFLESHPIVGVVPKFGLALFLGVAMSITAIPMLGRILIEMGIQRTTLAAIAITAAAVGDVTGWILLSTVASLVKSSFSLKETFLMIGLTITFVVMMFVVVRPLLGRYLARSIQNNNQQLSINALAVTVVALLLCSIITNLIGIFAIIGAFTLGAILSHHEVYAEAIKNRLRDIVNVFFLPIFFTYTGLKTQIGSLTGSMWLICFAVIFVAVICKFAGCAVAARMCGFRWKESGIIGTMMNTRGLMELIVINLGFELGVIPQSLFTMLVMMAILTTIMTSPILMLLSKGTELEEPIRASGFTK